MVRLVAVAIVMIACTDSSEPSDTTLAEVTTTSSLAPTITLLPPPEIDLGVDLESGVLRLAVVGQISDDMWAGHLAYWDSVNDDLGGVGGRFEVELGAVDSIREAMAVGALAVGIDVGDDAGTVLELLVATQAGSPTDGRLANLTVGDGDAQLVVAVENLGRLALDSVPSTSVLVSHPDRQCEEVSSMDVTTAALGAISEIGSPVVYLLCLPGHALLAGAAEVLAANPGSLLVVPGAEWSPGLAVQLQGTTVVVAGYVPEPGLDDAPAADVMGLALGPAPWPRDLVDGYTRALSIHVVIERALATGNLTRLAVRDIAADLGDVSLGFGDGRVPVGVADTSSPTGVRFVVWGSRP